ncbi:fatty acid-binding protein 1, liver-like [Pristis pectinata]|uniref:fatty acid-binding protein 1, liver-like n=1 Tax=Pristis pectinata TaxID=685728 RepID=UPI00223E8AF7|nr:fatty acid-binding protein 1, liver-like [Pristis pectinata]
MDFSGQYELQSQENMKPFMNALGIPDDMIEKIKELKSVTKIVQNGKDFIVAVQTGNQMLVNNFTLGRETYVETPTGEKVKATINLEGENKLVINTKDITSVAEFNGDLLINTITLGDIVYKRISKKTEDPDEEQCSSL